MASPYTPVSSRHQMLYKSKTAPWKETYRNQCRERLKNSRQALFESFRLTGEVCQSVQQLRDSVTEVVRDELDKFKSASAPPPAVDTQKTVTAAPWDESYVDDEVMAEMVTALLEEELEVWRQYEDMIALQNQEIDAAVRMWSCEGVVCPVCLRNDLEKKDGRILCPCGLVISTELSLEEFRRSVERVVEVHSLRCRACLAFSLIETGAPTLVCLCNCCDFMNSVL
ncbi:RPA-interacting protein B-like [Haemaphysalis longicornis]